MAFAAQCLPQRAVLAEPVPEFRHGVGLQAAGAGGAFDAGFDQARVLQHLEVAADSGLALHQHPAQLAHGQLALGQDVQGPEPSRFSNRS